MPARAHNGPPFPIIVDRPVGPCVISLWTHPDVGTGTFFVLVSPPPGGAIPKDLKVSIGVQPVTGRLSEVRYAAHLENMRGEVSYKAEAQFDRQEMWRIRVWLESAKASGEAEATVEVTPPGLGRWDLVWYVSPFVAVGFLWFRVMTRRRKIRKSP